MAKNYSFHFFYVKESAEFQIFCFSDSFLKDSLDQTEDLNDKIWQKQNKYWN